MTFHNFKDIADDVKKELNRCLRGSELAASLERDGNSINLILCNEGSVRLSYDGVSEHTDAVYVHTLPNFRDVGKKVFPTEEDYVIEKSSLVKIMRRFSSYDLALTEKGIELRSKLAMGEDNIECIHYFCQSISVIAPFLNEYVFTLD